MPAGERRAKPRPSSAEGGVRAAGQSAASLSALSARVRDLETVLAVERAEHAKRLREVGGHAIVLREALGKTREEVERVSEERERTVRTLEKSTLRVAELEDQVAALRARADDAAAEREQRAAAVVASSIARAQAAEVALAEARERIEAMEEAAHERQGGDPASLRRIRDLEKRVDKREKQLIRAAEMLDRYERRFEQSEARLRAREELPDAPAAAERRSPAVVEPEPQPRQADAAPAAEDSGTYIDVGRPPAPVGKDAVDSAAVAAHDADCIEDTGEGELPDVPAAVSAARDFALRSVSGSGSETFPFEEAAALVDECVDEDHSESASIPELPPVEFVPDDDVRPHDRDDAERRAAGERLPQIDGLTLEREVLDGPHVRVLHGRTAERGTPVAVHVLRARLADVDERRMASLIAARHVNLVRALTHGVSREGPYVVFARPVGEHAGDAVRRSGPMAEGVAWAVALQVARGLRHGGVQGLVHGDLRPGVVHVASGGEVAVAELGTAALLAGAGRPVADPAYAAPERLGGTRPSVVGDVYSLGALVYFLLTGTPPFEGERANSAALRKSTMFPDPRIVRSDVSDETAELVLRMTATDPAERPTTWDRVLVEMERRVAGDVSTVDEGDGPLDRLFAPILRWCREHRRIAGAVAALPVVLLVGSFLFGGDPEPSPRDQFALAVLRAERLADRGDLVGARGVYETFLTGTGDPDVEREAALRIDELAKR